MKLYWLTMLFLMCSVATLMAQDMTIKGTVTAGDTGEAIPGATVLIKGTTKGTVTDIDGNFSLVISEVEEPVLIFSFLGYKTQEEVVGGRATISPVLEADIAALDEVVVIGYGSQKKKVVTAATVKVTGESLEKRVTTNALQALQGSAAGVSIRSNSGQPGDGLKVNVRGIGTINNSDPLYIVDGMQVGDIKYLNNADIESIDILKDAASAAIFGTQGANGVVLITTKKGRKGQARLSFDAYYGFQNKAKSIDMLDAGEYARIMNEQHLNSGGLASNLPFDVNNLPAYVEGGAADTRWVDEMFVDNAVTQNYTLGLAGGSENSTYSISFSYTGQEGIVGGPDLSKYDRLGGRINSEHKFYDGVLTIGENVTITNVDRKGVKVGNQYDNTLRGAFSASPLLPVRDNTGSFYNTGDKTILDQFDNPYFAEGGGNPYGSMVYNNQNLTNERKMVGNVYMEIEPFDHFKIRSSAGFEYYSEEYRSFRPSYTLSIFDFNNTSDIEQRMKRSRAIQFDHYMTYDRQIGSHYFNVMLGTTSRNYQGSEVQGKNSSSVFDSFDYAWLNNATNQEVPELSASGRPENEHRLLSYFTRVQYNWDEKYLLNATFRMDASSKFGPENRWASFPSLSLGWVISEEPFMKQVSAIDLAKLRLSWGQNGNQAIDDFQFVGPIVFDNVQYAFGEEEGVSVAGSYQERLGNSAVRWETSEQIDIGADIRFLSNRFLVTMDWYQKSTIDWLVLAPILATAGADAPFVNGGKIVNTGFELELTYQDQVGDLEYTVSANGAINDNVVKEIPTDDGIVHGAANSLFANSPEFYRAEVGHPVGFFWGYESDGIFQNTGEVNAHANSTGRLIQPNAQPGDLRFVDRNDDGLLTDADKIELGNPNPRMTFGINVLLEYRAFDFSLMCFGVEGNDIVQAYRDPGNRYANYTTAVLDRWTGEGTSNTIPRVTNNGVNYRQFSSLYLQDGSYLRIGNLTLGYDFGKLINNKNISQLRVYAAVNNLYTFTNYDGMDPDIGYGLDNGSQDKFSRGIDLGYYPNPRTTMLGVSVKF